MRALLPAALRTMSGAPSCAARLHLVLTEQADLEIHGPVDDRAVGLEPAVGHAEYQLGSHDPLDVDAVDHLLHGGQNLAGKLDLAEPQRAALPGRAEPPEETTQELPTAEASRASGGKNPRAATAHRGQDSPASPDRL